MSARRGRNEPELTGGAGFAAAAPRPAEIVQREAADPACSAAIRAAAGSGKTHVLVSRIVRLLLAGAEPQSIVAVTFTRKAAVEIKERLLGQLRALAAADQPERRRKLQDLLGRAPDERETARAAELYHRLLEDLAGLPIGTIHSWCQRLLTRFAAEVGLDPRFTILERTEELWAEALDRLEAEAVADPDAREALARLAPRPTGARERLTRLLEDRAALDRWIARAAADAGTREERLDTLLAELRTVLFAGTALAGIADPQREDVVPLLARAAEDLLASARVSLPAAAGRLTDGLRKNLEDLASAPAVARRLAAAADPQTRAAAHAELWALVLTGKPGRATKVRSVNGPKDRKADLQQAFAAAARPLIEALLLWELVAVYRDNAALLRFGLRALEIYDGLKLRDRCLDFHDLERRARHLMVESDQAPFVQYRLDARVDHLLVDEFQDTNADQWEILEPLADEFLAGEGARPGARTLFIVGDVKQSIYRFRGAQPRLFAAVESRLAARGRDDEGREIARLRTLPSNFRSLPALVEGIGTLFANEPLAGLLPKDEAGRVRQTAERPGEGELRILPPLGEAGASRRDALRDAAEETARIIARLQAQATVEPKGDEPRPLRWSDVLVLCRSRTHVGAYEQALRAHGIPIVPSGRGALARSREVRDLLQLLRWLVFPRDDAALACVLRSPLLRVGEEAFQRLLSDRLRWGTGMPLWDALRRRRRALGLEAEAGLLDEWRRFADLEGCHDLLRRIYRGSAALERYAQSGLGEQARYNLLRLHDLALELDQGPDASLRRFAAVLALAAQTSAEEEAAPPAEDGQGRVQMLTVHGAKGLESPVVLLVDAAAPLRLDADRLELAPPGEPDGPEGARGPALVYGAPRFLVEGPALPEGFAPVRVDALNKGAATARSEIATEEADILYVAMTRARDRLFVLGSHAGRAGGDSYLEWLRAAAAGLPEVERAALPVRFDAVDWGEGAAAAGTAVAAEPAGPAPPFAPPTVPSAATEDGVDDARGSEYVAWQPPVLRERARMVSPSAQAPDDADPGEGAGARDGMEREIAAAPTREGQPPEPDAAARGTAIHFWLRLAAEPGGIPAGAQGSGVEGWLAEAVAEARAVAANPAFAWIFDPERDGRRGLSEAPVIHELPPDEPDGVPVRVFGVMDRLIVGERRVEIVDYKSNRITAAADGTPDEAELARLAELYRPQLEAYRAAAAALFPGRETGAHLLLTHARDAAGRQGRLFSI